MQYNPKLKKAMQEIQAIIHKYDIAGVCVLHSPPHSEYMTELSPSYSCAKFEGEMLRMKALKKDYPTLEAWVDKVASASNMLHHLSDNTVRLGLQLIQASEMIDNATKAEHGGGSGYSSHTQQNN